MSKKWPLVISALPLCAFVAYQLLTYAVGWGTWPWRLESLDEPLPQFVTHQYIDLDRIAAVSRFRSGVGHDASDSFETCRSMKHYFNVEADSSAGADVALYAPFDGQVVLQFGDNPGQQIWLRPDRYPQYVAIIFHGQLNPGLKIGSRLQAGEHIGIHVEHPASDIQIAKYGIFRHRFVSYFDVMTDEVFEEYRVRNPELVGRQQFVFTKAERDARPLSCSWSPTKTGLFKSEEPFDQAAVRLAPAQPQSQAWPQSPTR